MIRIGMIHDAARLRGDQAALNRRAVALLSEGVRLVRLVPESVDHNRSGPGELGLALVPRIDVPTRVLPWLRGARRARLAEELERHEPDLLHATGPGAWPLAVEPFRGALKVCLHV